MPVVLELGVPVAPELGVPVAVGPAVPVLDEEDGLPAAFGLACP